MNVPASSCGITAGSSTRRLRHSGADPSATLRPFGVLAGDPTHRWWPNAFARAVHTPDGPATVLLAWQRSGDIDAEAWGSGAAWLLDRVPQLLGHHDHTDGFDPSANPRVAELWRRAGHPSLGASGVVWQELAAAVLGQRVTTLSAARSWRLIATAYGEPAPGPLGLQLPPTPQALAACSYTDFHRYGVERRRAEALIAAARHAARVEESAMMPVEAALTRLTSVRGIGEWTATTTVTTSHAHPDVVVLGDYGLPTMVSYAFTGSAERVGDHRMLELLEPFAGHRWRVVRLLYGAGISAPRRGPRAWNPRIENL